VPGHADETNEPLVLRLDRRPQRAGIAHRQVPLARVDEAMELDQIDAVHAQPLERPTNLLPCAFVAALGCLRGQEKARAVRAQPRREPKLRLAVAGSGVDVVDPVVQEQLERTVRFALGSP
jgi:hypothetical protein